MCLAQGPQRSDAGEARTRYPSVSSQALYHWATALPFFNFEGLKKVLHIKKQIPCQWELETKHDGLGQNNILVTSLYM